MKNLVSITLLVIASISCHSQPERQSLESFEAYNGIMFEYEIIFPEKYTDERAYELAILFSETAEGDHSWDKALHEAESLNLENLILIVPKVPLGNKHWKSHPIHHGLNDLMKSLRKKYANSSKKFHFIGYGAGHNVAQTYSNMSSDYVASMSIINGEYWNDSKQEWFDLVINKDIPVYIYEFDQKRVKLDLSKSTFKSIESFDEAMRMIDAR